MRVLIFTILLALSNTTSGQTLSLSLAEAQAKALESNRNAQISELEIEKAKRVVKETMAIGLPQVQGEGSFQNFLDVATQVLPDFISPSVYGVLVDEGLVPEGSGGEPGLIPAQFGTEYSFSAGVSVNQMIFNGSYLVGLQAAKSYVDMSRLQKEKSDLDVKAGVSQSYHTALMAVESARVLDESVLTIEAMLNEIEAMYNEGFVEEQDVEQMQLTLNRLKIGQQNAQRQILLTKQLLNFQIGLPLETRILLTDDVSSLTTDPSLEVLLGIAPQTETHPEMLVIDQGIVLQKLEIKEMKSRYIPSLNGFFNYQQQAQRNEFNFLDSSQDWFPSTVWGLSLQVPIFTSGMRSNQVKQLAIDLEEFELQKELATDALTLSAFQSKSDYLFARESYAMEQENMAIAKRIRDKTLIKYQEGLASSFELNEIENQYLEAESRRIQASMSLLDALTELKMAYNQL